MIIMEINSISNDDEENEERNYFSILNPFEIFCYF